jgi:hypothetical protein
MPTASGEEHHGREGEDAGEERADAHGRPPWGRETWDE